MTYRNLFRENCEMKLVANGLKRSVMQKYMWVILYIFDLGTQKQIIKNC